MHFVRKRIQMDWRVSDISARLKNPDFSKKKKKKKQLLALFESDKLIVHRLC